MKKILLNVTMSLCVALMVAGCNVDDSFDFSNLNDSNIGLGTDDTYFEMPLFDLTFPLSDLTSDNIPDVRSVDEADTTDAEEVLTLLNQITCLLPTTLSGEYEDGIDLNKLGDEDYVEGLVSDLMDELALNNDKRIALFEMLQEDSNDYAEELTQLKESFGIDIETMSASECAEILGEELNDSANASEIADFEAEIVAIILAESENIYTSFDVEEAYDGIEIDDEILDILSGNLDSDANFLSIFASAISNLPMDLEAVITIHYTDANGNSKTITISTSDDLEDQNIIDDVETLEAMFESMTVSATIDLNNYKPEDGGLDLSDKFITLKFTAYKGGSFTL